MFRERTWFVAAISVLLCVGCAAQVDLEGTPTSGEAAPWEITELRADHGHDIIESSDGEMHHNYFCAVVLSRDDESIHLLYENELP